VTVGKPPERTAETRIAFGALGRAAVIG